MIIQWIKQSKNWTYSHSKSKISIQKKLQSMSVFSQLGYIYFSILFWSHPRFLFKKSTQISTITESNLFRNFFEGNFQSLKIHFIL